MHLRVLQEHFCIRWMILENYSAYYNINSTAYTQMLNQFEKDAQILGAVSHAENKSLIDWIESKRI
jgi:peptide subunit release factor 1 (eRF1)